MKIHMLLFVNLCFGSTTYYLIQNAQTNIIQKNSIKLKKESFDFQVRTLDSNIKIGIQLTTNKFVIFPISANLPDEYLFSFYQGLGFGYGPGANNNLNVQDIGYTSLAWRPVDTNQNYSKTKVGKKYYYSRKVENFFDRPVSNSDYTAVFLEIVQFNEDQNNLDSNVPDWKYLKTSSEFSSLFNVDGESFYDWAKKVEETSKSFKGLIFHKVGDFDKLRFKNRNYCKIEFN